MFYEVAVQKGLFLSIYQRSIYNEPNLRALPWWKIEESEYKDYFKVSFFSKKLIYSADFSKNFAF
jgi:hypothetical protein